MSRPRDLADIDAIPDPPRRVDRYPKHPHPEAVQAALTATAEPLPSPWVVGQLETPIMAGVVVGSEDSGLASPKSGRDDKGRFAPGNQAHLKVVNGGRPTLHARDNVIRALEGIFDEETTAKMMRSLRTKVAAGNIRVLKELLPYLLPKLLAQDIRLQGTGANGEVVIDLVKVVSGMVVDSIARHVDEDAGDEDISAVDVGRDAE